MQPAAIHATVERRPRGIRNTAPVRRCLAALALLVGSSAHAEPTAEALRMGFMQLSRPDGQQTTVFYPSSGTEVSAERGPFRFSWVPDGVPIKGTGRLIVISHGSGGSPWVHVDLARALVRRGFMVAIPLHKGDNYLDPSEPGPVSWRKRPQEISQAIDLVVQHPVLGSQLSLNSVGVFLPS